MENEGNNVKTLINVSPHDPPFYYSGDIDDVGGAYEAVREKGSWLITPTRQPSTQPAVAS